MSIRTPTTVLGTEHRPRAPRWCVAGAAAAALVVLVSCDDQSDVADTTPTPLSQSGSSAERAEDAGVVERFIAALDERDPDAALEGVAAGAPIAVSPLAPGEALDKDVTLAEQIGWLDAWGWRWDDVACSVNRHSEPTFVELAQEGADEPIRVDFDSSVTCGVTASTDLGDVDGAAASHNMAFRLLDGEIAYVNWNAPQLRWMPSFLDFKNWAEAERPELWQQAWNDDGPLITAESTAVEARLLDEFIDRDDRDGVNVEANGDQEAADGSNEELVVVDGVIEGDLSNGETVVLPWGDGFVAITSLDPMYMEPSVPYRAVYTSDGSIEDEFEFELPLSYPFFVAGEDRIAAFAWGDRPERDSPAELVMMTTTDLIEWRTARFDMGLYEDPVDGYVYGYQLSTADPIVVGDRWYAVASTSRGSWPREDVLLVGDFEGNFEVLPMPEQLDQLQEGAEPDLVPYRDGLMLVGWNAYTSGDGRAWTELGQVRTATEPGNPQYLVTAPVGDDMLVYDPYGGAMTRIEPDGEFVEVEYPEQLDGNLYSDPWVGSPSAWVTGPRTGDRPWERDLWLIAAPDGVDWFTLDLTDPTAETAPMRGELHAFVNGGLILYNTIEGWRMIRMGEGVDRGEG